MRWPVYLALGLMVLISLLGIGVAPVAATDGDESAASLTSFTETLADDVIQWPDSDSDVDILSHDDRYDYSNGSGWSIIDYSWDNTEIQDGDYVYFNRSISGSPVYLQADTSVAITTANWGAQRVYARFKYTSTYTFTANTEFGLSAWEGAPDYNYSDWDDLKIDFSLYSENEWHTVDADFPADQDEVYKASLVATETGGNFNGYFFEVWLDWFAVTESPYDNDTTGYCYSFADVSDWTATTMEAEDTASTDGDVLTVNIDNSGGNDVDEFRNSAMSIAAGTYWGFMGWVNVSSASYSSLRVIVYSGNAYDGTSTSIYFTSSASTWVMSRQYVSHAVESVRIYCYTTLALPGPLQFKLDLMRGSPETEHGWQHDGSTTQGVTAGNGGTTSTDSDYISLVADADNSVFDFYFDTTVTAAKLEDDYYEFLELQFNTADSAKYFRVDSYDGSNLATVQAYSQIGATGLWRWNLDAVENDPVYLRVTAYASQTIRVDYFKAYSIANFTVTQANLEVTDLLYVDSSAVVAVVSGASEYFTLNHDPALSVATATYNVWNTTLASSNPTAGNDYAFAYTTSGSGGSQTYDNDESRGDWEGFGGTLTDCAFIFYTSNTLAGIKFIEDATALTIGRSSAQPPEPYNDEAVTLSAMAFDTVEVYKVWFVTISSPAGAGLEVDYEATEQQSNLWTYEFASLATEGYYAFKVVANDGANNSTVTSDNAIVSVFDFTVRLRELSIVDTEYTATSTRNGLSGVSNAACTWTAYDNESLIDSGSIAAAGSFFVSWDKQTTEGDHIWGVSFTDGVTTRWTNGTYEAEGIVIENAWAGQDNDTVYVTGQLFSSITTLTYTVYENTGLGNVLRSSGSITLTSTRAWFSIEWAKSSENVEANFTLVIDDGTNNSTIYGFYTERAAEVTNITNAGTYVDGDDMHTENYSTVYEGYSAEDYTFVLLIIVFTVVISMVTAVVLTRTYYIGKLEAIVRGLTQ